MVEQFSYLKCCLHVWFLEGWKHRSLGSFNELKYLGLFLPDILGDSCGVSDVLSTSSIFLFTPSFLVSGLLHSFVDSPQNLMLFWFSPNRLLTDNGDWPTLSTLFSNEDLVSTWSLRISSFRSFLSPLKSFFPFLAVSACKVNNSCFIFTEFGFSAICPKLVAWVPLKVKDKIIYSLKYFTLPQTIYDSWTNEKKNKWDIQRTNEEEMDVQRRKWMCRGGNGCAEGTGWMGLGWSYR